MLHISVGQRVLTGAAVVITTVFLVIVYCGAAYSNETPRVYDIFYELLCIPL